MNYPTSGSKKWDRIGICCLDPHCHACAHMHFVVAKILFLTVSTICQNSQVIGQ